MVCACAILDFKRGSGCGEYSCGKVCSVVVCSPLSLSNPQQFIPVELCLIPATPRAPLHQATPLGPPPQGATLRSLGEEAQQATLQAPLACLELAACPSLDTLHRQ